MRRLSLVLSLAMLIALAVTGVAKASTQQSPVTAYTMTQDIRVTMSDGVTLDTDEYVPTTGCPCPTILIQTPYRKSGGGVAEANTVFPSHGYAEVVADVRGTGSSEGYWDSFGAREQQDGAELVRYAAHRPFSNGVIGLAGVSYSAINQFLTVEQPHTSAVKAIFPIVPMSDAYRDVTWAGGNIDSGFIPLWLGLVTGLSAIPAQDAQTQPQIALNAESEHLMDIARFQAPVVGDSMLGYYESSLPGQAQTYPDASYDGPFAQLRSPLRNIDRVHQPTFIVGGLYDIFQRGEPLLYQGLQLPTSKKKLLIGPWYHTTAGNGLPATDAQGRTIPDLNTLQLEWFDHFLKGYDNGVTAFPDETYFQGVNKFEPGQYPWGQTPQKWFLGASPSGSGAQSLYDGSLGTGAPNTGTASLPWTVANGLCSRNTEQWTAGLASPGQCETDERPNEAQAVTFTSPAFTSPYAISGPIDLHLYLQSLRPDSSLIATVTDVTSSGTSDPLTSGSLVLSERQLTTTACGDVVVDCTEYANGAPIIPWHPYTRQTQSPLQPSTTYAVDLEIFPTSIVLPAGDRLRISLTSSDVPHESPTLSTTADSAGNVLTLLFGPATPSYVYVESFKPSF
ncbi:MAG TPA: CocE/NonD family hydrolase [Candidatus Dormibacteraeota bacterium]